MHCFDWFSSVPEFSFVDGNVSKVGGRSDRVETTCQTGNNTGKSVVIFANFWKGKNTLICSTTKYKPNFATKGN